MSKFFKDLTKTMDKMDGVSTSASPPSYWLGLGNYCLNKIISGRFKQGIGQGRLCMLAGPSGAGKSFVVGNIAKAAQEQGQGVFIVDSENALDDTFMEAIGVDVDDDYYMYAGLNTITDCTKTVSGFMNEFRALKKKDPNFPPFVVFIDSLDMLETDSEEKNYAKGIIKGDQGQQAKQLKKMLKAFVHDIKGLDICIVCTKQVYQEQDAIAAMQNPWRVTESLKFAFSQILLVTKLALKDKKTNTFEGIRLKAQGFKTRFTKPFQRCEVEVPYDGGMDPFNGLLEAAEAMGVVEKNGAWYTYDGNKFQKPNFSKYQEKVLEEIIKIEDQVLKVESNYEEDLSDVITQEEKSIQRKTRNKGK